MCQSPMPRAEYKALQERIRAQQPTECPRCRSDSEFTPTFDVDGPVYACDGLRGCGHMWSPES